MKWIEFKGVDSVPQHEYFIVWDERQENWLECSVDDGQIICELQGVYRVVDEAIISHWFSPKPPVIT